MTLRNILFVCRDNALLGPMAEACLNAAGGGRFRAFSAGSDPAERLHPGVARLLAREGFDPAVFVPKPWQVFAQPHAPRIDTLVALGTDAPVDLPTDRFFDPAGAPQRLTWDLEAAGHCDAVRASSLPVAEVYRRIRLAVLGFLAGDAGALKAREGEMRRHAAAAANAA